MSTKVVSRLVIVSVCCFLLRLAFSGFLIAQPVMALLLIYLLYVNVAEAILAMAGYVLLLACFFGFGPWIFWQMACYSMVLVLWGYFLNPLSDRLSQHRLINQALMAGVCSFCYHILLDSCFAYLYSISWWSYIWAGMLFTVTNALATMGYFLVVLLLLKRLSGKKGPKLSA